MEQFRNRIKKALIILIILIILSFIGHGIIVSLGYDIYNNNWYAYRLLSDIIFITFWSCLAIFFGNKTSNKNELEIKISQELHNFAKVTFVITYVLCIAESAIEQWFDPKAVGNYVYLFGAGAIFYVLIRGIKTIKVNDEKLFTVKNTIGMILCLILLGYMIFCVVYTLIEYTLK